jgi:hypothetical protein
MATLVVATNITTQKATNDLQISLKFPITSPSTTKVVGNILQLANGPLIEV